MIDSSNDQLIYRENGMRRAIFCASIGLFVAFILNLLLGTLFLAAKFPLPILLAVAGLYGGAFLLGKLAGNIVYRTGTNSFAVWIVGVLLAWSCILVMTLAGASVSFFSQMSPRDISQPFFDYVIKPAIWVALFGFIPALILGLVWARQMRKIKSE